MNISEISIRNPVFAWMLMTALILFGWIGFSRMGVSELPDVDFPVITVQLSLEGAAPEVMEADVVDIIEDAVTSIQGIREITSSCRHGIAFVTIEFELSRNIDAALQEVQTKIAQEQGRLPHGMEPPVVTKTNPEDRPILWVSLSGDRPIRELMTYARDRLKDQFQILPGVGQIFLGGFLEPNLRIWVDQDKLEAYQLTLDDVITAIEREHQELPAGRIETVEKEFNIRTMGEATSTEDFGGIRILSRGGAPVYQPIYLRDVATIEKGLNDFRRISRVLGKPAVGLGILKQRGANAVEVARRVREKVESLQKGFPEGMSLGINFDGTRFIEESVQELNFTLLLSAILTGVVCWLFLGSWSSTLNVLMAIPTSIVGTFLVLYFAGFTLNNFTLLGLILAVGIVVDDAIMVLENIVRHQEGGEEKVAAALRGSRQISFAALSATLAIVAIFLPVAFMTGVIGRFFFQFGVTMSVAVGLSLLEALTLTPMRCSQFVTTQVSQVWIVRKVHAGLQKLVACYRRSLPWSLAHPKKILLASLLFFVVSILLLKFLPKEFAPAQDQSMMLVRLQTPVGSSLEFTSERMKEAEGFLMKQPEFKRYYAAVGGFGGGEVNTGMLFVTLKPKKERKLSQADFMDLLRTELNKIPDTKAFIQDLSTRGFAAHRGYPVEFTIRGPDWAKLVELSEKIRLRMTENPIFVDIDTDYQTDMPEVQILPDRQRAAERGVSIDTIARTISTAMAGTRAGRFLEGGRRNDIRVRLEEQDRTNPEDILRLMVRNNRGELISLKEVATTESKPSLLKISRINRERAVELYSNLAKKASQAEAISLIEQLSSEILPVSEGYHMVLSGSTQTFKESFRGLSFALLLGIIISYMILASQFNSFLHPLSVLIALPFSISGAIIALLIGGQSLNIYSMIGLILLMGIVKKNSILLVDFTNQIRSRLAKPDRSLKLGGDTRLASRAERAALHPNTPHLIEQAILEACPIRLRPILMTSVATIAAAIPPAISLTPGSESRIPMAIAVIGGVIVSTILSLFVVPSVYSLLTRWERK
ncbi:MAG: efflux RND transporter permease subunit [Deltaproteobacteria bacterium]|nr:efflux RND transporter permease subunit [Deltaproteobacteria bacterium]